MIKEIHIKNFRSIKDMTLEPQNLCVLLGPNSAGKTNVLKALDLLLGEGWATKARVAREFFYDPSKPILIEVIFSHPISFTSKSGYQENIESIRLEMRLDPELEAKTYYNVDKKSYSLEEFKKLYHFIYIPADRDLSNQMRVSSWTLLGKLMRLIYENYVREYGSEDRLKEEFEKTMKAPKSFLEKDFNTDLDTITFKNFVNTFQYFCKLNSAGLASQFTPRLEIYNLNWFYKTLQIHIREDFPEKEFDAEEIGAGMQNLLLISIFQTYAKLMGGRVVFGIEEPEIYLYPQAQRQLYRSFINLACPAEGEGAQIFYTTHNPNFVDAARADEFEMLRKNEKQGTYNLKKDSSLRSIIGKSQFKIYTHFNTERNEIFFAKKVLLVEGDSDKILFGTLCEEKWDIDLDQEGISVIECSGKTGVLYFIGVCRLLGIEDFFAVWDEDPDENPLKDEFGNLEYALKNGKGLEIPGKLDSFLKKKFPKLAFREDKKIEDAYQWAQGVDKKQIPVKFLKIKEFLSPQSSKKE